MLIWYSHFALPQLCHDFEASMWGLGQHEAAAQLELSAALVAEFPNKQANKEEHNNLLFMLIYCILNDPINTGCC
jgi:hypothetical protein